MKYAFPGNVRELKNMVERAVILCDGNRLSLRHFPNICSVTEDYPPSGSLEIFDLALAEKNLIARALKKTRGNKSKAAELLNISRQSLDRRIIRFGLSDLL